jgi:hypothetical protein
MAILPPARWTWSRYFALALFLAGCATTTTASTTSAARSFRSATIEGRHRQLVDSAVTAALGLNTLTTSCNGGCGANAPCVVVGTSSENRINCVNDTRCTTLSNGKAALCMEPFGSDDSTWEFSPAKANSTIGVAPFEQVGLIQPGDSVTHIVFRQANAQYEPLSTSLDLSSIIIQPNSIIANITFDGLELTGADDALSINSTLQLYVFATYRTPRSRLHSSIHDGVETT